MFIKSNILFQRMICPILRAIFNAAARGEYGGKTQTDHWVLERKNHFLKAGNF